MDQGVQWIFDALRRQGKLDNTYVFFLSDNGFFEGPYKTRQPHHTPMYSWNVSGSKAEPIIDIVYPLMSKRRRSQIDKSRDQSEAVEEAT